MSRPAQEMLPDFHTTGEPAGVDGPVPVSQDRRALWMEGGDDCTPVWCTQDP
jgi:hypothetical protein